MIPKDVRLRELIQVQASDHKALSEARQYLFSCGHDPKVQASSFDRYDKIKKRIDNRQESIDQLIEEIQQQKSDAEL